jgi:hypothetical protein
MLRKPAIRLSAVALAGVLVYLLVSDISLLQLNFLPSAYNRHSTGNLRGGGIKSTDPRTASMKDLKLTKALAHQPGFTVFENL